MELHGQSHYIHHGTDVRVYNMHTFLGYKHKTTWPEMMMPISLIENKNINVYIMQNLDLKYLHKKKLCINPFRW